MDALKSRKSTRAFLDREVSVEQINHILESARHAPSGANTQPWKVAVLTGDSKRTLCSAMEQAYRNGDKSQPDYQYYPLEWREPYKSRRRACGMQLYSALEIQREEKQRQQDQWAANYRAFDAPMMLLIFMERGAEVGSFLDCGMFVQSIMLAAIEEGLATCPQASLAEYPDIVKRTLGYPEDDILVCGIAIGYEDKDANINSYRTPREELESFVRYFE